MAGDPPTYSGTAETPAVTLDTNKPIPTKPPGFDRFLNLLSVTLQIGIFVVLVFLAVKIQALHRSLLGVENNGSNIRRPLVNVGYVSRISSGTVTVTGVQTMTGTVGVTGRPTVSIYTR